MVLVIHNCDCKSCPGTKSPPKDSQGRSVFSGTLCNCSCHTDRIPQNMPTSFLDLLKKEYEDQDNRATSYPIYVSVQELICIGVLADGYSVNCPYGDGRTKTVYVFPDFEGQYDTQEEIFDMLKEDGRSDEVHKIEEFQLGYIWHPIEFFLTIKGAEEFMKLDAHNHGELRTYVHYMSRRNLEMRGVLENLGFKVR